MISRTQRILFWLLLVSSVVMSVTLLRLRERAHDRLLATADTLSPSLPVESRPQSVTLMIANDMDGSMYAAVRLLPLPADRNARAHVVLQRLIQEYAQPGSPHPIAPNNGVSGVFFMPLSAPENSGRPGVLAVVDLSESFAAAHPSGIEPEMLTLLSILGTLHANFPEIDQVRFLVGGQPRETLAGHADLSRAYLASDAPGIKHL